MNIEYIECVAYFRGSDGNGTCSKICQWYREGQICPNGRTKHIVKTEQEQVKNTNIEEVIRGVNADKLWDKLTVYFEQNDKSGMCQIPEEQGGGWEHGSEPQRILTETAKAIVKALLNKFYIIEKDKMNGLIWEGIVNAHEQHYGEPSLTEELEAIISMMEETK